MSGRRRGHRPPWYLATWPLVVLAGAMLVLIAIPASVWRAPQNDIEQSGFDPVMMYADGTLVAGHPSSIEMTESATTVTVLQGSQSIIHLVTSPLSFSSSMTVRIDRAERGSQPATFALTSPYGRDELRLVFGAEPGRLVSTQTMRDGRVVSETVLGSYAVGETYRIEVDLDRASKTARLDLAPLESQIARALVIDDLGEGFESHVISQEPIPVTAGETYRLSADVLPITPGLAGLSLEWLDDRGARLDLSSDWAPTLDAVWGGRAVEAVAPDGAAFVRAELAVEGGGSAGFGRPALRSGSAPDTELLANSDFADGAAGWRRSEGGAGLNVREYANEAHQASADAGSFPELFGALRMAFSFSSAAGPGVAQATLTEFELAVPHQRWMAMRVADPIVTIAVILLGLLGGALLAARAVHARRSRSSVRTAPTAWVVPRASALVTIGVIAVYATVSTVLAHAGSLNADTVGARVWTYAAGMNGIADLYLSPNVASAEAAQWQGQSLQEAGFPYGPTMAYVFGLMGAIYRFGIAQAALSVTDVSALDYFVRFVNGAFGLVSAWLIYRIVLALGVTRRRALVVGGAFLLAPALVVANSVWGTTQSISLAVLLSAILFTVRKQATLAWVFTFAAAMTRPQNLIIAVVLAVFLLRVFPVRRTLTALPIAVVVVFVCLVPLSLSLAPSLPADVVWNALFMHVGDGNDSWTLPVSWGAFTPWTLFTSVTQGVSGTDAILFPATAEIAPGLSYYRLGTVVFAGAMIVILVKVAVSGRTLAHGGRFLVALTLAILSLLLLKTGTPGYHMLLPTALAFLLIRAVPRWMYVTCATILSATTLLSMYGMGAHWLTNHPDWGVGVYEPSLWIAQLFAAAVESPIVVAVASVANVVVFVLLTYSLFGPGRARPSRPLAEETIVSVVAGSDRDPLPAEELTAGGVTRG